MPEGRQDKASKVSKKMPVSFLTDWHYSWQRVFHHDGLPFQLKRIYIPNKNNYIYYKNLKNSVNNFVKF